GATLRLINRTVSGSQANGVGGGVWSAGVLSVVNSTITANTAMGGAAGGLESSGTTALLNTIIAGNTSPNCGGGVAITSVGHNLDSDMTCQLMASGDLPGRAAQLGPLQDNGGPTSTHALL